MAFFNDQLQNIFNLRNGQSVILDQGDNEGILIKLETNGFEHTFLLRNNCIPGTLPISFNELNEELGKSKFVFIECINDTNTSDLAVFLNKHHPDTAINILKNLSNPNPTTLSKDDCKQLIKKYSF